MYKDVNFETNNTNRVYYSQTMTRIEGLKANNIEFKIYIDEYYDFRKIILNVLGSTALVKNMYFVMFIILLFARPVSCNSC
jgi:hypothetical protein